MSPSSQRHARGLVRRRGGAVLAVALLGLVAGGGAGAAVVGPENIEVLGWRPVDSLARAAADAPSQSPDPAASVKTDTLPDPANATAAADQPDAEPTEAPPEADPAQLAAEVVAATNAQRTAAGLPELAVSPCATEQVASRVAQLVATDTFEHPPLEPVLSACSLSAAGENLFKGHGDGAGVVDAWMNSEKHRANLLGEWTETGVSCQLRGDGQWLCGAVYTRPAG